MVAQRALFQGDARRATRDAADRPGVREVVAGTTTGTDRQ
ncbi:Hypothetical protein CAP_1188 [Chondromyces apiculatus DSM 436]|uniref:Uncharacterized protein n=1 Tax=Chondromyces apiculatus DSM 436 TaxID=1192034 RepID=A0A017TDP3_9BACT|nr:Hypothetical protein CAP_1188 [Chondromyces apiculatus DSM 436]